MQEKEGNRVSSSTSIKLSHKNNEIEFDRNGKQDSDSHLKFYASLKNHQRRTY